MSTEIDRVVYVKAKLKGCTRKRVEQVAEAVGMSHSTLRKIVEGTTGNPGYYTVKPVYEYLVREAA